MSDMICVNDEPTLGCAILTAMRLVKSKRGKSGPTQMLTLAANTNSHGSNKANTAGYLSSTSINLDQNGQLS